MYRCSPEQIRELSPDQEAAIKFVPVELISPQGRYAKRGAQVFLDLTHQQPPEEHDYEQDIEPSRKRVRFNDDAQEEIIEGTPDDDTAMHSTANEESTREGDSAEASVDQRSIQETMDTARLDEGHDAGNASSYGPIRERHVLHEPTDLTRALRQSTELLDLGNARGDCWRTQFGGGYPSTL